MLVQLARREGDSRDLPPTQVPLFAFRGFQRGVSELFVVYFGLIGFVWVIW